MRKLPLNVGKETKSPFFFLSIWQIVNTGLAVLGSRDGGLTRWEVFQGRKTC